MKTERDGSNAAIAFCVATKKKKKKKMVTVIKLLSLSFPCYNKRKRRR